MEKTLKNYLIPTNNWLRPIKLLARTSNQIFDAELIESEIKKNRVIVKVTKTSSIYSHTEFVYSIIGKSPYVVKIHQFITCYEDPITLNADYKNAVGFCEGGPVSELTKLTSKSKSNQMIHLELMARYRGSLNEYIEELSINKMISLLRQAICIQLDLFCTYGFVHGDIHPGNLLIEKTDETHAEFSFCGNDKRIDIVTKLYLTDFEHSIIYSQKVNPNIKVFMSNPKVLTFSNTIGFNLINTFTEFIRLLRDVNLQHELSGKLNKWIKANEHTNNSRFVNPLFDFAKNTTSEFLLISKGYNFSIYIVSELFELLFGISF